MLDSDMLDARYEYNQKILDKLKWYLETYPFMRFGQALINLNIITINDIYNDRGELIRTSVKDPYNEESVDMYNRITNR